MIAFCFGIYELLLLRFETGDIYPRYSTFRADPLGTKAFYQALRELPDLSVSRNYVPLKKLRARPGVSLLFIGVTNTEAFAHDRPTTQDQTKSSENNTDEDTIVGFIARGGRLIVAQSPSPDKTNSSHTNMTSSLNELGEKFGFRLGGSFSGVNSDSNYRSAVRDDPLMKTEKKISWHTNFFFDELADEWRKIYSQNGKPVIIERNYKNGSIVVCTDSFFLSNEAMRFERNPQLLAWLLGDSHEIVFDESHLGVALRPGIATLARKYRLGGLLAVLMLLAGLFIWRSAISFLPRDTERICQLSGQEVEGRDSASGLLNLLRKSVHPQKILPVCLQEWIRSSVSDSAAYRKVQKEVQAVMESPEAKSRKHKDKVTAYRRICQIISERKW